MRRILGAGLTVRVPEDAVDDHWLLNAGDDAQPAAALPAGLDIDGEHPLGALRAGEAPLTVGGRWRTALAGLSGSGCA
jgi:hypothetical protein